MEAIRSPKILALTMAERRELVRQIQVALGRGIRLDSKLVAEAKDSLILHKPEPKPIQSDEPTREQLNRMLRHFGVKESYGE